jgi:hypothetical protein
LIAGACARRPDDGRGGVAARAVTGRVGTIA